MVPTAGSHPEGQPAAGLGDGDSDGDGDGLLLLLPHASPANGSLLLQLVDKP
jgi:hypothetical protein